MRQKKGRVYFKWATEEKMGHNLSYSLNCKVSTSNEYEEYTDRHTEVRRQTEQQADR